MQRPGSRGKFGYDLYKSRRNTEMVDILGAMSASSNSTAAGSSYLEQENDRMVENLRAKATALKSVRIYWNHGVVGV